MLLETVEARRMECVERTCGVSTVDFQRKYAAPSVPVILTDLLTDWRAMKTWTLDFFAERFGDRLVGGNANFPKTPLGEGIRKIQASLRGGGPAPYLNQIRIPTQLPELFDDISPPIPYVTRDRMSSPLMPTAFRYRDGSVELFIGGPGAGFSLLHYDLYHQHVFIAQVLGHKAFRVFSPNDRSFLYPHPDHPNLSLIPNAFDVDLARFPDFAKASPIDFVLNPGEVFFAPAGWWHTTKIDDVSISVARNTLDRHSWPGFVADYRRGVRHAGVTGRLRTAYVRGLGAAFLMSGR